jgi:hypothetical protein
MRNQIILMMAVALAGLNSAHAITKSIRPNQLNEDVFRRLNAGEIPQLVVEFRQGDLLPLTVKIEGDLLETIENHPSSIVVRKPFFVKIEQDKIQMSMNGIEYKPFQELLKGKIDVGASSDQGGGPANAINVLVQAFLR